MIAFGPVPSRRLGRSLGINNIPPKTCTYACIYCQAGHTTDKSEVRRSFYKPERILQEVSEHLSQVGQDVDYLSFVPDGEPTLDINLGRSIEKLHTLGIPVAVITNASLLWQQDVRQNLSSADWVSLKVDAAEEPIWKRLNRPNPHLDITTIQNGIREFAGTFSGELVTETMLVEGVNDGESNLRQVAAYIASLQPRKAYISIPTRPPAVNWVQAPDEVTINRAYHLFSRYIPQVECLTGYEGNAFAASGDFERDLLSITAVHPLREGAVRELCRRDGANWDQLHTLLKQGKLARVHYDGENYILRRWKRR
jgi:wyosine [tRNA(Phe)-imidazoG37] synthetase (radical SAM superfamily)